MITGCSLNVCKIRWSGHLNISGRVRKKSLVALADKVAIPLEWHHRMISNSLSEGVPEEPFSDSSPQPSLNFSPLNFYAKKTEEQQ